MEQRDYLLRQIELMAQALASLIRRLTGLKEEGSEEEMHEITNELLKEQLDIDLNDVVGRPLDEVAEWIADQKGVHKSNVELFAEVLVLNAKALPEGEDKNKLLQAALELYGWADRNGDTFSVERHIKMNEIKTLLFA